MLLVAVGASLLLPTGKEEVAPATDAAANSDYDWLLELLPEQREKITTTLVWLRDLNRNPTAEEEGQPLRIEIREDDVLRELYRHIISPLRDAERVRIEVKLHKFLELNFMLRTVDGLEMVTSISRLPRETAQALLQETGAQALEMYPGEIPVYIQKLLEFYREALKAAGCEGGEGTLMPLTLPDEGRADLFRDMKEVITAFVQGDEMGADDIQDLVEEWWPEEWNGLDGGPVWKSWQEFIDSLR